MEARAAGRDLYALNVVGKASFSRSGRIQFDPGTSVMTIALPGVSRASMVLATPQSHQAGVYVTAAAPFTNPVRAAPQQGADDQVLGRLPGARLMADRSSAPKPPRPKAEARRAPLPDLSARSRVDVARANRVDTTGFTDDGRGARPARPMPVLRWKDRPGG